MSCIELELGHELELELELVIIVVVLLFFFIFDQTQLPPGFPAPLGWNWNGRTAPPLLGHLGGTRRPLATPGSPITSNGMAAQGPGPGPRTRD